MTESMVQRTGNPTTVEATDKHYIAMSDLATVATAALGEARLLKIRNAVEAPHGGHDHQSYTSLL